jgi:hypothetical protein
MMHRHVIACLFRFIAAEREKAGFSFSRHFLNLQNMFPPFSISLDGKSMDTGKC